MPDVRRTQQERVQDSTRLLFRAAADLIAEVGFDAATAAEIGRRAGFSRSMVRARFGSKQQLLEAILTETYQSLLLVAQPDSASGLQRVLARIGATAALLEESPALVRIIFTIEFQAAGNDSALTERVAHRVTSLRADILAAITAGLADGSVRADINADSASHGIVADGIGTAFIWLVNPADDMDLRVTQWRERTLGLLTRVS